jgi:hypothetical protein
MLFGPVAANWADDMFEELSWDFGAVPRGPAVTHAFRFKNTTADTLHIGNVRVSCGCTHAVPLKTEIRPGEESAIMARMDTTRFHGHKQVTVFVTIDEPGWNEVSLVVRADGRDDVVISPESINFGRVAKGKPATASAEITVYDPNLAVRRVRSDTSYVQPRFREVDRSSRGVTYEVTAKLEPGIPAGQWYTELMVSTNSSGTKLRIPVNVEVEANLQVAPAVASLGRVKAGSETEKRIMIRGSQPFKITSVTGTDSQLSVQDTTPTSKTVHILTVKFKPARTGSVTKTVRVQTDLKDDSQIEFKATAEVTR